MFLFNRKCFTYQECFKVATIKNARIVKQVIENFCGRSGLNLNLTKSKVYFSKSNGAGLKRAITDVLGFSQSFNLGRYLGVLLQHGRLSRSEAGRLIDKVMAKYEGWKKKYLSTAGRATLIQSVTSAIPIYEMQSSWLPAHICERLDTLNRNFLWANDVTQRKTHLVGWKQVVESKRNGGMGIREARTNNEARLAKLVWKVLTEEKTIWFELIKAKYLKGNSILSISAKNGDSSLWKGILKVVEKLRSCIRWRIGNGEKINFWFDNWNNNAALSTDVPDIDPQDRMVKLSQVLNEFGEWNFSSLHTEIPQSVREEITGTNVVLTAEIDRIMWNETASGKFTCQSAYHTLRKLKQRSIYDHVDWNLVWKNKLTNKMKHFLWLAIQDRLNTNSLRFKRRMTDVDTCPQCNNGEENVLHILRHCIKAKTVWKEVVAPEEWIMFDTLPDLSWWEHNLTSNVKNGMDFDVCWLAIFLATIWIIWKSRNEAIFRGAPYSKNQIIFLIKRTSSDLQYKMDPKSSFTVNQRWIKPHTSWQKLNVDGSVRTQQNRGAIGCDKGEWVWGLSASIKQPTVNESELISLVRGLERAWELKIPKLQVELDYEVIYKWVIEEEDPPLELSSYVKSCKLLLKNSWETSIKRISRKANACADHLVSLGYNYEDGERFWQLPPISVIPVLNTDIGL